MTRVEGLRDILVFAVTRVWRGKWLISECVNGRTEARGDMYSIYNSPSRWQPIAVSTFWESSRVNSFLLILYTVYIFRGWTSANNSTNSYYANSGLTKICGAKQKYGQRIVVTEVPFADQLKQQGTTLKIWFYKRSQSHSTYILNKYLCAQSNCTGY